MKTQRNGLAAFTYFIKRDANGGFTASILAHRMSQNGRWLPVTLRGTDDRLPSDPFLPIINVSFRWPEID